MCAITMCNITKKLILLWSGHFYLKKNIDGANYRGFCNVQFLLLENYQPENRTY